MIGFRCEREHEVLDALSAGRWPEAVDRALRDHVDGCGDCRDLVTVAAAMIDDRREAETQVDLPSSGAVWWRMQLRMERESKQAAEKTVGRIHGAVVGVTVAAITMILLATSAMKLGWKWIEGAMPQDSDLAALSFAMPPSLLVAVGLAILVFAPVALYLAFARE